MDGERHGFLTSNAVDGSEIRRSTEKMVLNVNSGISLMNYQPQLVLAGFLNHQQY